MLPGALIRTRPAISHNDSWHDAAWRDDEISRLFCIPTCGERLDGRTFTDIQGNGISYLDVDMVLLIVVPD